MTTAPETEARNVEMLNLPFLDTGSAEFCRDPFTHFEEARREHPWLATCDFGFAVLQYQAIRELMLKEDNYRMSHAGIVEYMGGTGTPWGRFIEESMQAQIGPAHKRLRDIVAPAFTPRQANRQRGLMRQVVTRVIDEWAPRGAFDFEQFASNFPISMFCEMIGADPSKIPQIRKSMETIGLGFSMDRSYLPALQDAVVQMTEFVENLVAGRRRGERRTEEPDLLDALLSAVGDARMSDDELTNLLIFLFVAGFDTSKNELTLIMYRLLDKPDIYERCAEDIGYCRKVVEESFRYNSPASSIRVVEKPFSYRGVHFPKDTMIFMPWNVATRDPGAVDDPEKFDPEREHRNRHIAFGLGPHICLGKFIALAQIEEGLHQIAQRIRNPRLAGNVGWRPYPGVWGIKGLPIRFDA